MKAIVLSSPGGAENLSYQEIEKPSPRETEVLIKVKAISINPVDVKTRKGGSLYGSLADAGPVILGWDVAGVVEAVGLNAKKFKPGDDVFGMINFPGRGAAYAEYVSAPESHLALKPTNIGYDEAAATTLAALTAWQVLVQQASLTKGQHVLLHAAAGGVGHFAVQIAKHLDAIATGTASEVNKDYLLELGVDYFIDYKTQALEQVAKDVDIVLDSIGGETTQNSLQVIKPGGILVSIVGGAKEPVQRHAAELQIMARNYLVHSNGEDMEQLATLLKNGSIKATISHRYSFDQMAAAHTQIESGRTRGKIVVLL